MSQSPSECAKTVTTPEPGKYKYTFFTTHMTKIGEHTYRPTTVEVIAENAEIAYEQAQPQFPEGSRLFCWISDEPVPESTSEEDEVQGL